MAVDWPDELDKRLNASNRPGMLAHFHNAELRRVICDIVREEMPRRPKFKSKEEAYNERFATTKGGSHSAIGSKIAHEYVDNLPAGQINRRNFVEALHSNPLCKLPPAAWVSRSEKLEHGKSRALFACDTMNYMHFDAPCTAIERVWLG